ncbi:hypothetical protein L9F63_014861, partial [Diploptera punctata]
FSAILCKTRESLFIYLFIYLFIHLSPLDLHFHFLTGLNPPIFQLEYYCLNRLCNGMQQVASSSRSHLARGMRRGSN